MPGAFGHRRQQGDGSGAAADDDDLLAAVIQILGPVLRVHYLPGEAVAALELWRKPLVVAVISARTEDPVGADLRHRADIGPFDVDGPASVGTRPSCAVHLVVEPDLAIDTVLGGRLTQVGEDLVGGGDGVVVAPRLELVPERM